MWRRWQLLCHLYVETKSSEEIANLNVSGDITRLPADGSANADFDADNMTVQEVYDYLDALIARYPNYIKKETMGKDASNTYDWNRYVLYDGFYHAWQRQNYPKMYAWVNGSTIIYSVSVSPRVGDTLYSTAYIGTAKGTVTAVDNANQTRTVGGVVYTRDTSKDVGATLVYCISAPRPDWGYAPDSVGAELIDTTKKQVTTISNVSNGVAVGKNGITYERKPMLDRGVNITETPPLIVVGANEHGNPEDPREPAIVCLRIMNLMCNPSNDSMIKFLQNCKVVFMPIMNPYGFTEGNNGYYNVNGININRNYDVSGWVNQDTTSGGPKGSYGGSEIETQYIMNTYYGADVGVSIHCYSYGNSACDNEMVAQGVGFTQDLIDRIASIMWNRYQLAFGWSKDASPDSYSKSASYINHIGAKGGIIEMNAREGATSDADTKVHSGWILHADYVLLIECLKMWSIDAGILSVGSSSSLPDGNEVEW